MKFAGRWMDVESIRVSEDIQTQKDKNLTFSLICGFSS